MDYECFMSTYKISLNNLFLCTINKTKSNNKELYLSKYLQSRF